MNAKQCGATSYMKGGLALGVKPLSEALPEPRRSQGLTTMDHRKGLAKGSTPTSSTKRHSDLKRLLKASG